MPTAKAFPPGRGALSLQRAGPIPFGLPAGISDLLRRYRWERLFDGLGGRCRFHRILDLVQVPFHLARMLYRNLSRAAVGVGEFQKLETFLTACHRRAS